MWACCYLKYWDVKWLFFLPKQIPSKCERKSAVCYSALSDGCWMEAQPFCVQMFCRQIAEPLWRRQTGRVRRGCGPANSLHGTFHGWDPAIRRWILTLSVFKPFVAENDQMLQIQDQQMYIYGIFPNNSCWFKELPPFLLRQASLGEDRELQAQTRSFI